MGLRRGGDKAKGLVPVSKSARIGLLIATSQAYLPGGGWPGFRPYRALKSPRKSAGVISRKFPQTEMKGVFYAPVRMCMPSSDI